MGHDKHENKNPTFILDMMRAYRVIRQRLKRLDCQNEQTPVVDAFYCREVSINAYVICLK